MFGIHCSNFCPLRLLFTSDIMFFGDQKIIFRSKKTFSGPQKTNLSDVNNTFIDIGNVQKFELSITICLQTKKFMDRPTRNDDT